MFNHNTKILIKDHTTKHLAGKDIMIIFEVMKIGYKILETLPNGWEKYLWYDTICYTDFGGWTMSEQEYLTMKRKLILERL